MYKLLILQLKMLPKKNPHSAVNGIAIGLFPTGTVGSDPRYHIPNIRYY
ncbi:hypothetical protein ACSVDA_04375 [Cytobacillus sp. Hm23]